MDLDTKQLYPKRWAMWLFPLLSAVPLLIYGLLPTDVLRRNYSQRTSPDNFNEMFTHDIVLITLLSVLISSITFSIFARHRSLRNYLPQMDTIPNSTRVQINSLMSWQWLTPLLLSSLVPCGICIQMDSGHGEGYAFYYVAFVFFIPLTVFCIDRLHLLRRRRAMVAGMGILALQSLSAYEDLFRWLPLSWETKYYLYTTMGFFIWPLITVLFIHTFKSLPEPIAAPTSQ